MWEAADVLIKAALPLTTSDTKTVSEWISQMATLPQASNLATRILLLTLLFEVTHTHTHVCHSLFIEESASTKHYIELGESTKHDHASPQFPCKLKGVL